MLGAPIKARVEHGRTVLDLVPHSFFWQYSRRENDNADDDAIALNPLDEGPLAKALGSRAELMLKERVVPKVPSRVRVRDCQICKKAVFRFWMRPALKDDFYYNLIDWSSKNFLSVGLNRAVFLWSAATSKVILLTGRDENRDEVSSVCWSQGSSALAVGGKEGSLQLWDPEKREEIISYASQNCRVGSLSWNINTLASGSRAGNITYLDQIGRAHV